MDDVEISSFGRWQWANGFNTALTAISVDLKQLPSTEKAQLSVEGTTFDIPSAEPKKGKWIDKGHDNIYQCSACGDMWMGIGGYRYCPSCGADMRGEKE